MPTCLATKHNKIFPFAKPSSDVFADGLQRWHRLKSLH